MGVLLAVLSIVVLVLLHELGHFLLAKRFGVKVEEFGLGLPWSPALAKVKKGETEYSLYPLLIGAFVRMEGEETNAKGPRSFQAKPLFWRILIVTGGVASSWLAAFVILTMLVATVGLPAGVADEEAANVRNPQVRILDTAPGSPAEAAGLEPGDAIGALQKGEERVGEVTRVSEVQEFVGRFAGQEIEITLEREGEERTVFVVPRENPPAGEGALGVGLVRTGLLVYPPHEAPFRGVQLTGQITANMARGFSVLILGLVTDAELPPGTQVAGPVGVVDLLGDSLAFGAPTFFALVAQIAVVLAFVNTVPIPALDGGRLAFLLAEAVIRRPLPEKPVQILIAASFALLIPLILWVTVQDVSRIFF